jgi:hypothetical protein
MVDVNVELRGAPDLEMETDGVRADSGRLTTAGQAYADGLTGILATIAANVDGIGTNSGAADFKAKYDGVAPGMIETAGSTKKTLDELAKSATEAVTTYEEVDQKHRDQLRRLAGG